MVYIGDRNGKNGNNSKKPRSVSKFVLKRGCAVLALGYKEGVLNNDTKPIYHFALSPLPPPLLPPSIEIVP